MIASGSGAHALVVYGSSRGADAALRALAETTRRRGGRLTVLSLVAQEAESRGCCDTRSVLWNEVCRELRQDNLARAALAVDGHEMVELDVLLHSGRRVADAVTREAERRGADQIVLVDPGTCGLRRGERRRLRRRSQIPVSD